MKRQRRRMAALVVVLLVAACGGDDAGDARDSTPAEATTASAPPTTASSRSSLATTTSQVGVHGAIVCGQPLGAGVETVACDGMTFRVGIPDACPEAGCGLIADIHGGGDGCCDGAFADRHTTMQHLGTSRGYVVVQPNMPGSQWTRGDDDLRLRAFMEALIESLGLDANRVHVGGFSSGGWMTWWFVCDHADFIASAAPSGAGASFLYDGWEPVESCDFDQPGHPSDEVDILFIHGRLEEEVPFDIALEQRDLVIAAWNMTESAPVADEATYKWSRWLSPSGTVLEFVEHDWSGGWLGGHCYPGAGTDGVGCGSDTPIHYGEVALRFYMDHPRK